MERRTAGFSGSNSAATHTIRRGVSFGLIVGAVLAVPFRAEPLFSQTPARVDLVFAPHLPPLPAVYTAESGEPRAFRRIFALQTERIGSRSRVALDPFRTARHQDAVFQPDAQLLGELQRQSGFSARQLLRRMSPIVLPQGVGIAVSIRSVLDRFYSKRVLEHVKPGLGRASRVYRFTLRVAI